MTSDIAAVQEQTLLHLALETKHGVQSAGLVAAVFTEIDSVIAISAQVGIAELAASGGGAPGRGSRDGLVLRISLASPLETVTTVGAAITSSTAALTALIYMVKQLWSLDLELRTQRAIQRDRFEEARTKAELWRAMGVQEGPFHTEATLTKVVDLTSPKGSGDRVSPPSLWHGVGVASLFDWSQIDDPDFTAAGDQ